MSDPREPTPFRVTVEPFADKAIVQHARGADDPAVRALVQLREQLMRDPASKEPQFRDRSGELFGHERLGMSALYARWRVDPATRTARIYDVGLERDRSDDLNMMRARDDREIDRWRREVRAARMPEREFEQHREQLLLKRDKGELTRGDRQDLDVANLDASNRRMAKIRERQQERTRDRSPARQVDR